MCTATRFPLGTLPPEIRTTARGRRPGLHRVARPGANAGDPPIKPKLYVNMNLDGRRVAQVIGDDWILNDGGETTIVVNDVTLHDGVDGVVLDQDDNPVKAANGTFDVWIRETHRRYFLGSLDHL